MWCFQQQHFYTVVLKCRAVGCETKRKPEKNTYWWKKNLTILMLNKNKPKTAVTFLSSLVWAVKQCLQKNLPWCHSAHHRLNISCDHKNGSDYLPENHNINHNKTSITTFHSVMYMYSHSALQVSSATPRSTQNYFVAPHMHPESSIQ
jgi:hypothetical protein